MPELPDVEVYCEALTRFYAGRRVESISLRSPFVVRSVETDLFAVEGRRIQDDWPRTIEEWEANQ